MRPAVVKRIDFFSIAAFKALSVGLSDPADLAVPTALLIDLTLTYLV